MGQPTISSEIAPTGTLRTAMIWIRVMRGIGEPVGRFVAEKLGVAFEPVVYPSPQTYEHSFGKGEWDIAIGARAHAPADKADLTPDLWLVDLIYLAAEARAFADPNQIDRPGVKVGAIQDSPSERFLRRTLKFAEVVPLPLSANFSTDAIEMLRSGKADVFGADFGLIDAIAGSYPGAKVIPGAFTAVRVAIALPKGRSSAAQTKLHEILKEAKRTGVVQKAIEQAGLKSGVRVAPE